MDKDDQGAAGVGETGSNVGEVDPGVGADLSTVLGSAEVAGETGATARADADAGTTDTDNGGTGAGPGTAPGLDAVGSSDADDEL